MIPPRVARTAALLIDRGCSHAVAVGEPHVVHLAGYSRYLGGPSAVVVSADGARTLVVPRYELSCAEELATADRVVAYGGVDLLDFNPLPSLMEACVGLIDGDRCALAAAPAVRDVFDVASEREWVEFDADLDHVRRIKDVDETARIRDSFQLALIGQQAVAAIAESGASEIELFTAAHAAAQEAAGQPVEFIAAVAAGTNSALIAAPMHVPGENRATRREALLCDIAIRHRGYWGDSTRTYGEADEVVAARDALTEILDRVAAELTPGTSVSEVYERMARAIHDALPESVFPHHGGHGIGVEVGEDPQIIPDEQTVLETGMVFAVEPGAYFAGRFGARVENTYVINSDRAQMIADWEPPRAST